MTKRILSVVAVAVLGLLGFYSQSWMPATADSAALPGARALPVQVIKVAPASSYQRQRDFTGLIAAARASDIGFELGGKVVDLQVDEGARVTANDIIATLDTRQLSVELERTKSQLLEAMATLQRLRKGPRDETIAAAKAELRSRESGYQLQANNLERRQGLARSRAISEEEVDQSRFGVRSSAAEVEAARARLNELLAGTRSEDIAAQEAVVDQLTAASKAIEVQLEDSVLKAPFDGTISQRYVDEGSVVAAGAPVVRVIEDDRLEARIGIPVDLARYLACGASHPVSFGDQTIAATLRCVLPELNLRTQTRMAIFDLATEDHQRPGIGEIARVRLQRVVDSAGFWLPATAVERGQRGLWSTYVIGTNSAGQSVAQRRDIEVLFSDADRVFARGTLLAGDQVVSSGLHRLSNEQLVTIVEDSSQVASSTPSG